MSRYGDDYDDSSFPNEAAFWQANYERALKGKRGRQALRDLRDALLALPEPRLIEGALCTVNVGKRAEGHSDWYSRDLAEKVEFHGGEGVCAVGAFLWHRKVKAGMDPAEAFDSLPTLEDFNHDISETADIGAREGGMALVLAFNLAYRNDELFGGKSPEGRYTAFLEWIDAELGETAASPS